MKLTLRLTSLTLIFLFFFLATAPALATAGTNNFLTFQGKMVNTDGTNVTDGVYDFIFNIYDGATSGASSQFAESWTNAALYTSTMSTAPGDSGESLVYVSNTNEASLKVGQILWNTTKGEAVTITSVNTGTNTLGISPTRQAWTTSDAITNRIYVKDGIFRVALNSLNQSSTFSDVFLDDTRFLGINFNTDGEMKPRVRLTATPYAMNAASLGGIDDSGYLRSNTSDNYTSGTLAFDSGTTLDINGDLSIADTNIALDGASTNLDVTGNFSLNTDDLVALKSNGYVGIGTTNPGYTLDVNGNVHIAAASDLYVGSIGLNDNASTSSGGSLVGLFDDSMTYISGNTTVQGAVKQLDTAINTLSSGAVTQAYQTIQEEGAGLTQRSTLNFIGGGFTAADNSGSARTDLTLDATLNSLAAFNSNGILTQTAADTFAARTITGTTNRLTVTNGSGVSGDPTLDIAATYVGQTSITTLGTIASGTWNGTAIGTQYGGTGQNWSAVVQGNLPYFNGTGTMTTLAPTVTNGYVLKYNTTTHAPEWATDNNTTYTAGNDLDLTGTQFDIESQLDYVSIISRASSNLTLQTTTSGNIILNSAGTIELQDATNIAGNTAIVKDNPYFYLTDNTGTGNTNISLSNSDGILNLKDETNTRDVITYDASANTLSTNPSVIINTTWGTTPFSLTRTGTTTESLQMFVSDSSAFLISDQDENIAGYGNIILRTDDDGSADGYVAFQTKSGIESMRITSGGSVGIGTTNPGYKLEVVGDINTTTGTFRMAGTDYGQYFIDAAGSTGQVWTSDGSGRGAWAAATGGATYWQVGSGALSPINSTLDLLVGGTSTAAAKIAMNATTGDLNLTGQLQLGTYALDPTALGAGSMYYNTGNNGVMFYNGTSWQKLAASAFFTNSGTIANGDYLQVAHNQNTNNLITTAWVQINGIWKKINDLTKTIIHNLDNQFNPEYTQKEKVTSVTLSADYSTYGTGADGDITVSTNTNTSTTNLISGRSCADGGDAIDYSVTSLTATTATLSTTPATGCLTVGDEILLINSKGTSTNFVNIGNYETLRVNQVSGSIITFTTSKTKYYGDNPGDDTNIGTTANTNQAVMLIRVPNYRNVTVNSSINFYANRIIFFRATGTVNVNGTIDVSGANAIGYIGGTAGTSGTGGGGGSSICSSTTAGDGGDNDGSPDSSAGVCGGGGGAGQNATTRTGATGSTNSGGAGGGGGNAGGTATGMSGYGGGGGGGGYGTAGTGGAKGGGSATNGGDGGTNSSGNGGNGAFATIAYAGGGGGGGTIGDANIDKLFMGVGGGGGGSGDSNAATSYTAVNGGAGGRGSSARLYRCSHTNRYWRHSRQWRQWW